MLLRKLAQHPLARLGVLAVVDLEAAEPGRDQTLDVRDRHHPVPAGGDRVRDDRHSPGLRDQAHRGQRIRCVVRLVVALARMEDPVERLGAVADDAPCHEGVCDVGAADGRIQSRLSDDVIPGQVVVAPDVANDPFRAPDPIPADAVGLGLQSRIIGVEEVAEHVHTAPIVLRGKLHPRDECHAEVDGGVAGLLPSGGAIVIGERRGADPVRVRLPDHLRGRLRAIGLVGVQMQVGGTDEPGGRRGHPPSVPSATTGGRGGARRRMSRQGLHRRRS